jgi:uncharacterized protein YbjT (DUF2867 family)
MTQRVVTLFGGTGFIGRHLVAALARRGMIIRVATRDIAKALDLKTAGAVGQITSIRCNPDDAASVASVITGSDTVINLIGILYERGRNTFTRTHVTVAETIARTCQQQGVQHLVHLSALGADINSDSHYAQSKARGEQAVRAAFPDATIFRPSIVFGPEDDFFNRFARMTLWSPFLPLIDGGKTKFQPVYVGDVVKAILTALDHPETHHHTYELGGPAVYSFADLLEYILRETGRSRILLPLPLDIARIMARVLEILPKPMLTRDQLKLLARDNIVISRNENFTSLGIVPSTMEAIVPGYLAAYRQGGRFAQVINA